MSSGTLNCNKFWSYIRVRFLKGAACQNCRPFLFHKFHFKSFFFVCLYYATWSTSSKQEATQPDVHSYSWPLCPLVALKATVAVPTFTLNKDPTSVHCHYIDIYIVRIKVLLLCRQVYPGAWSRSWADIGPALTLSGWSEWINMADSCLPWWQLTACRCCRTRAASAKPASFRPRGRRHPTWDAFTWNPRGGPKTSRARAHRGLRRRSSPLVCNLILIRHSNPHTSPSRQWEAPTWSKWPTWRARPHSWTITQTAERGTERGSATESERSRLTFRTRRTLSSHRWEADLCLLF